MNKSYEPMSIQSFRGPDYAEISRRKYQFFNNDINGFLYSHKLQVAGIEGEVEVEFLINK